MVLSGPQRTMKMGASSDILGSRSIYFGAVEPVYEYRDLGGDYFDRLHPETLKHKLVRRLEALGLKVTVEPMAQTA